MPRLISTTPRVRVEPKISPRALPRSLMAVYYLDESQFRRMLDQLESSDLLKKMVTRGVIERVHFRGKIPQHRYEEYKDEELVDFFRKYAITQHADWQQDLLAPGAVARRHELARKYRVPLGPLTSVLRYLAYVANLQNCSPSFSVNTRSEEPDFLTFAASPDTFDASPLVETVRRFVERNGLAPEEFNELFLACRPDPDAILRRVSCPVEEVQAVLAALSKLEVLNSLHFEMRDTRPAGRMEKGKSTPIAQVVRGAEGINLELRFLCDRVYDVKYLIRPEEPGARLNARERELIEQLRAVNQRKTVLCRIVACLFRHQYRFLVGGDPLQMQPLTQALVARELQEEEATISRLIRDKTVVTPQGELPLKRLFRKVAELVRDLVRLREARELASGQRTAPFTDSELQALLEREYGLKLSRRAITYHRNRTSAGLNYYARSRQRQDASEVTP